MRAMVLPGIVPLRGDASEHVPLTLREMPIPQPGPGDVLLRVLTCGVCHTELDEIEGRTPPAFFPIILGHQVVGVVEQAPPGSPLKEGDRVGVAWIFSACGECEACRRGEENLCPQFRATGRDVHGGYAEYMVAPADFVHLIPDGLSELEAAPLLCAGAIGYRSLRLTNLQDGEPLGLTGFGASGHLVLKMARYLYPRSPIFVFSRNPQEREFARSLGATWAGAIEERSPQPLRAIIDTTPVWRPVLEALKNLAPGGRLVMNAIRKEEHDKETWLHLDYPSQLWLEKEIKSVANVTRRDVREFLELAVAAGIRPEVQEYPLEAANRALWELKQGRIRGAKVLRVSH
jgi:propanol-preferring alcohol dehydrogenase